MVFTLPKKFAKDIFEQHLSIVNKSDPSDILKYCVKRDLAKEHTLITIHSIINSVPQEPCSVSDIYLYYQEVIKEVSFL